MKHARLAYSLFAFVPAVVFAHSGSVLIEGSSPTAQVSGTPSNTGPVNVSPQVEKFFYGWRLCDQQKNTIDTGTWTTPIPPINGTWRSEISSSQGDLTHPCNDGRTHNFNRFYYTFTNTNRSITTDSFSTRWRGKNRQTGEIVTVDQNWQVRVIYPTISINSASLSENRVVVVTSALSDAKGKMSVSLVGSGQEATPSNPQLEIGPGTHSLAFNRLGIPRGNYFQLQANWLGNSESRYVYPWWKVQGYIRHTQYNTPSESACPEPLSTAWIIDNQCNFTQTTLRTKFLSQTLLNGSGRSVNHGILKFQKEQKCRNFCVRNEGVSPKIPCTASNGTFVDRYPEGANQSNAFLSATEITGSCNSNINGMSSAVWPNPVTMKDRQDQLRCGNQLLLAGSNTHTAHTRRVDDYCDACGADKIDNWSPVEHCSSNMVGDLGFFWTASDTQ